MISNPDGSSPLPKPKFDRKGSEPLIPFSQFESPQLSKRDKKKLGGIFKKRGAGAQGELVVEEKGGSNGGNLPRPRSPLLSSDWHLKTAAKSGSFDEGLLHSESPEIAKKPLVKPMASPKASKRRPGTAGLEAPRRPPPPIPSPPKISQRSFDTEDKLISPDKKSPDSEGEEQGSREPTRPSSGHRSPDAHLEISREAPKSGSEEEEEEGVVTKSESMEELLKNLEEFDEVISSQNGLEVPEAGRERDFATIPRSELPVKQQPPEISITSAENQVGAQTSMPEMPRKSKPDLAPKPNPVQNGVSHAKKERERAASPVAPPRRKKGTRQSQKMKDKMGKFEATSPGKNQSSPAAPQPTANSPPPKPERDEKKRMKSRLEAMMEHQVCSSAPVSRTVSPDITESEEGKEGRGGSEGGRGRREGREGGEGERGGRKKEEAHIHSNDLFSLCIYTPLLLLHLPLFSSSTFTSSAPLHHSQTTSKRRIPFRPKSSRVPRLRSDVAPSSSLSSALIFSPKRIEWRIRSCSVSPVVGTRWWSCG